LQPTLNFSATEFRRRVLVQNRVIIACRWVVCFWHVIRFFDKLY